MGTGLIYAAIVAAWAAYLVPLWLRRHDEAAAARSVNGVSTAMRVLARRRVPVRPPSGDGQVVGPPPRARPGVGPSAAARRRRTLVALICLTTLVAILATVGALPWWNLVIPLVLIAGFLVVSVSAARRERLVRPVAPQAAAPREGARVEASSAWASAHGGQSYRLAGQQNPAGVGGEVAPDRGFAATTGDLNRPAELRVDDTSDGGEVAQPAASTSERPVAGTRAPSGDLWDPVEVPLPTYVTKAKAPRTVRTVDLADQGTWTTARLPEAGMLSRPEEASAMLLDETGHNEPGTGRESGKRDGSNGDQRRAVGD